MFFFFLLFLVSLNLFKIFKINFFFNLNSRTQDISESPFLTKESMAVYYSLKYKSMLNNITISNNVYFRKLKNCYNFGYASLNSINNNTEFNLPPLLKKKY